VDYPLRVALLVSVAPNTGDDVALLLREVAFVRRELNKCQLQVAVCIRSAKVNPDSGVLWIV
jgi:hypothetical protein